MKQISKPQFPSNSIFTEAEKYSCGFVPGFRGRKRLLAKPAAQRNQQRRNFQGMRGGCNFHKLYNYPGTQPGLCNSRPETKFSKKIASFWAHLAVVWRA